MATIGDPYWDNVVLAMHMDGANNSTSFVDEKGKLVTAVGNAKISTAQSKFGGASALFDGTGDYLSIADSDDFWFGAGNYTVEGWARVPATVSATQILVGQWGTGVLGWNVILVGTNGLALESSTDGAWSGARDLLSAANVYALNTWFHWAITRNGNLFTLWCNGVNVGTLTVAGTLINTSSNLTIGAGNTGTNAFNGYLDDLRITKAVARYTVNFTPPVAPFLHASTYELSGTVSDDTGALCARTVRAYRRIDGMLVGSAVSDTTTGAYTITTSTTDAHTLIVLDDAAGTQHNALVLDNVTPV